MALEQKDKTNGTRSIRVRDEHHIAHARHEVMALARDMGLDKMSIHEIGTSVTELASNLVFHTDKGGTIRFRRKDGKDNVGVEIVSEDQSPGIADLERAMEDGFSTGGGLGSGLPGVRRLMDEFDIASTPGGGTTVVITKWKR